MKAIGTKHTQGATMIKKMKYINWDTKIFFGFYESILYSSDTLYNMSCDNELKDDEFYDFYDDEQGNYTYAQYEQAVAKDCVNALFANLVQGSNDIIKDMQFVALHSPAYYNFETDKLEMEITVDWDKLLIWVQENCGKFNQYLHDEFTSCSGFTSFIPNNYNEFFDCLQDDFERLSQVIIEFYILQNLDYDSYYQDCAEIADEQIWNYVKIQKQ